MLNAVVVVLRETLEASFLISLTLLYSDLVRIKKPWLVSALAMAFVLSVLIATNMHFISDWFEGVGQEILFAIMLSAIALSVMALNLTIFSNLLILQKQTKNNLLISFLMGFCITNAIALEGSEIIIYFESARQQSDGLFRATVGSLLGAGIGFSIGVVCYYSIRFFKRQQIYIVLCLLTLVSAGMLTQSVAYLSQAGIIDAGLPLWNSNNLIEENSLVGQFLYAIIGYESTPTLVQVITYCSSIIIPFLVFGSMYLIKQRNLAVA